MLVSVFASKGHPLMCFTVHFGVVSGASLSAETPSIDDLEVLT